MPTMQAGRYDRLQPNAMAGREIGVVQAPAEVDEEEEERYASCGGGGLEAVAGGQGEVCAP